MGGSRKSQLLFSCGVLLTLANPAWADFVGIVTNTKNDPDTVALCNNAEGASVPFPLTVCNIFATFDDLLDQLLGIENADLQVYDGKTPDVFFHHPDGNSAYSPRCEELPDDHGITCPGSRTLTTRRRNCWDWKTN